jgi:hypothetical protein
VRIGGKIPLAYTVINILGSGPVFLQVAEIMS